jgi:hypothetical protein
MNTETTDDNRPIISEHGTIRILEALSFNHIRADIETVPPYETDFGPLGVDITFTNGSLPGENGVVISTPEQFFKRISMDERRFFTVYIGDQAEAIFELDTEFNAILEIYTFGPSFQSHPKFASLHECLYVLSNMLEVDDLPLNPITHHLDYKVMRDGTRSDTGLNAALDAFYGTVVVPTDISLRDIHFLAEQKFLTLDISNVRQDTLNGLRRVQGSLYSTQPQVVLRQLRQINHSLILPNATCVAAPYLCEIKGSLHAPAVTFIHMPMLDRVHQDVTLSALEYADFHNLGAIGGNLDMPLFKFGSFPILLHVSGHIITPDAVQIYAPHLNEAEFKPCIAAAVHQLTNQIKNGKLENEAA